MESFRIFTTFFFLLSWRDGWNDAPAEGRNAIPSCSGTLDDFSHWQHLASLHCATTAFFFHSSCYVMVNYWCELSLSDLLHLHVSFFFIFIPKKSFCFCSLWALIWRYVLAIPRSSFEDGPCLFARRTTQSYCLFRFLSQSSRRIWMSVLTQGWQDLIMTCEPFFPCDVCWGIEKETVCSMGEQWVQCWQLSTVTFPSKMINWYLIQIFRIVLPKNKVAYLS